MTSYSDKDRLNTGSVNGLLPARHQAIITWTNANLSTIEAFRCFCEFLIKI